MNAPINQPVVLYEDATHRNILLPEYGEGSAVQANQHLIVDKGKGIILDPGGHKVYSKVLSETMRQLGGGQLEHIFLSHQDPRHRRRDQRLADDDGCDRLGELTLGALRAALWSR